MTVWKGPQKVPELLIQMFNHDILYIIFFSLTADEHTKMPKGVISYQFPAIPVLHLVPLGVRLTSSSNAVAGRCVTAAANHRL
ncbi:hypothetical protein GDO78_006052 [Eleutherodactylus coqui]|uniref:Uncharacterized protein n=1 Tax=Eleutherodactylus coqui TaxID=57060 RepID=A0A8J6KG86_ELECQ|nr:hypothetical protein GDO78_006052 [Eleutherodactylus coqui]